MSLIMSDHSECRSHSECDSYTDVDSDQNGIITVVNHCNYCGSRPVLGTCVCLTSSKTDFNTRKLFF